MFPARIRLHFSHRGGIQGCVAGAMVLPPLHDAPSAAAAGRALRPRRAPAVPRRAPILPRRHHLRVSTARALPAPNSKSPRATIMFR